jgi:hypothetical protein
MTQTSTTYRLTLTDSDDRPAIYDHPSVTRVSAPYLQDSGRYRVDLDTTDAAALESALDAATDVVGYERAV